MKNSKRFISFLLCIILTFSFIIPAFADSENSISRVSCSVNGDTSTERGFCWYTKQKDKSKIIIYKDDVDVTDTLKVKAEKVQKWKKSYVHKVKISGLEPSVEYTYKILSADSFKEGKFKTDDEDNNLDFIIFADVQASNSEYFELSANAFKKAYDYIPSPDFICSLGDFTNDSTNEEWDAYFKNFEQFHIDTTFVPVAGNHDGLGKYLWFNNSFNLDTSRSVQNLNGVNYSFDYANAHFTVLNTNDEMAISITQMKWLESDVKASDKDWKIVLMHKSPYTLGKDGRMPDAQYLQVALPPVFDRCGVDIVFSGHDHMYLRTKKLKNNQIDESGTTYVLSGTLGKKRYAIRTYLAGTYLNTDHIAKLSIQDIDANYWNGNDWDSYDLNNVGFCFNCVSIKDDKLTLKSYIYRDQFAEGDAKTHEELTAEKIEELNSEEVITCIDEFTLTPNKSKATVKRIYKPNVLNYTINFIPSFERLAKFAFGTWLPNFFKALLKGQKYY